MFKKKFIILCLLPLTIYANNIEEKIKQQNINVVKAAAQGLSEKLPQQVDKYTSLIKIQANGAKLVYIYEINDPQKSDQEIAKIGKKKMETPVKRGICNSSKRFLESGIDISYVDTSARSKKELFHFDVSKKDCKY